MAIPASLLLLSAVLLGFAGAEPDYCKRGSKISESYQHCFEEAHFRHPFPPLFQHHEILDGCMVEAYANHTCRVVKPQALRCFRRNIRLCDYRERLYAIADESGGACFGNHINREFKEHVLNFLQPVRGDSQCFILSERAYECYIDAGYRMAVDNPNLHLLTIEEFMPVANTFFNNTYNCFIEIFKSNEPICENWQIPLLLELQGTALPSLFGMTFTAEQMDRLELHGGCPVHLLRRIRPQWRTCYDSSDNNNNNNNNNNINNNHNDHRPSAFDDNENDGDHEQRQRPVQQKKKKGKKEKKVDQDPLFLQRLREQV